MLTWVENRSGEPLRFSASKRKSALPDFERSFSVAALYGTLVRNQQKLPCETPTRVGEQRLQRNYSFAEDLKGEEPLKNWQVYTNFRQHFHA